MFRYPPLTVTGREYCLLALNGGDSLDLPVVLSLDYLELARSHIQYLLELFLVNLCWLLLWMTLLYVVGFGLKLGHLLLALCYWILLVIYMKWFNNEGIVETKVGFLGGGDKMWLKWWERTLWRKLLLTWVLGWTMVSLWIFFFMTFQATEKRKETLASTCDERARMLQDQFNVSMNHIQAMSILISTFYHAQSPSAIDQRTFARYTERTAFERPLTSSVAYAVRVLDSKRE